MVFFIVNPRAGQGMGLRLWEKMKEEGKSLLGEEGFSVFFTEKQGDARLFAREITREINKENHREITGENPQETQQEVHGEYSGERNREAKAVSIEDRICVIGGTGTLNEVIDGAMLDNNSFPISFLPVHRDNDFARALQKGYKIPESLSALFAKEERKVDYGIVEGERGHRRFVVSVGLGFEAAILQELLSMGCSICPKEKQRIRSKALSYFYAFVKELKRAKKIKGSILLDGESLGKQKDLSISCMPGRLRLQI